MNRRARSGLLFGLVALATACASVLGIDRDYVVGGDASALAEAAPSNGAADAPSGCAPGTLSCLATGACVKSCAAECPGATVECLACDGTGVVKAATCESKATAASCVSPPNVPCGCDAAADCPGPFQVCQGRACTACGAPKTQGLPCAGGKKCDNDDAGNPAEETTCH